MWKQAAQVDGNAISHIAHLKSHITNQKAPLSFESRASLFLMASFSRVYTSTACLCEASAKQGAQGDVFHIKNR
jgi:hypothetical protein